MKLFITLFVISLFSSAVCFASELDVLMARTSLALADEYAKLSTEAQAKLAQEYQLHPESTPLSQQDDISDLAQKYKADYEKYKDQALKEYQIIFCTQDCQAPFPANGLQLSTQYNFLKREAFTKYDQLSRGSNTFGTISEYSTIYAANSNFEDHLLAKVNKLIELQQRLDQEARRIHLSTIELEKAYVDQSSEVIGIDQALIRDSNYLLDTQTQISGFQSCVQSETLESNFEAQEIKKTLDQLATLEKNKNNYFSDIFSNSYEDASSNQVFKVFAASGWTEIDVPISAGGSVLLSASGYWNVRGALDGIRSDDLYWGNNSWIPGRGFDQDMLMMSNPLTSISVEPDPVYYPTIPLETVVEEWDFVITMSNRIKLGMESSPEGYFLSYSTGLSEGTSSGTSMTAGLNIGPLSFGGGVSEGTSSGTSVGQGGTYGLKLRTTDYITAPLGALIGSWCDETPTATNCEKMFIGRGGAFSVPSPLNGKKLWVRANDKDSLAYTNKGSIQLQVASRRTFLDQWTQFNEWYEKPCDENGVDCGLAIIIENVAYTPNPQVTIKSALLKRFPGFSPQVIEIIMNHLNYLIEMKVAQKDLKMKELSAELHHTKIANCQDQLNTSLEKMNATRDLIATYERRTQNVRTKNALLDTAKRYYDSELAAINNIREKNLERLKRYLALTISSYNYLYLDNLKLEGEATPYFEGDYYNNQISLMEDLISEMTAVNDLLNPNRGFVVYELSPTELKELQSPDSRIRKTNVSLNYNDFFCRGFNIENQARVMIEKMGVLLDLDPVREYLFFKNPYRRSTQVILDHGLKNDFFDFSGNAREFWMPAQKRNIAAHSTRILADSNSDYMQLRDSNFFERTSFRKTSFSTDWHLEMTDPGLRMYEESDILKQNPILKGVKLVFWFNSTDFQGEGVINECLTSPNNIQAVEGTRSGVDLSWQFPTLDRDFSKIQKFSVYRSSSPKTGFKPIAHINATDCSEVDEFLHCSFNDSSVTSGQVYYQVRSSYQSRSKFGPFMDGEPSEIAEITLASELR